MHRFRRSSLRCRAWLCTTLLLLFASAAGAGSWLPEEELFEPPLASPEEPRFFAAFRQYRSPSVDGNALAFGAGETLPIYSFGQDHDRSGVQLAIHGGVIGLLDIGTESDALVNADYIIGIPLLWRNGPWSGRLRFYHQSSHLGDDYLIYRATFRTEFAFESLELLLSYDNDRWRLYGGGEYLWQRIPAQLDPLRVRGGFEYRSRRGWLGQGRPYLGVDLRAWEELGWDAATAVQVGVQFDNEDSGHFLRLFAEMHTGYSPHGQFFIEDADWAGIGLQFGF